MSTCSKNPTMAIERCIYCLKYERDTSCQLLWGPVKDPLNSAIMKHKLENCKNTCKHCNFELICSSYIKELTSAIQHDNVDN